MLTGGTGHTAALPDRMPRITFHGRDASGLYGVSAVAIDGSINKAVFEAAHVIDIYSSGFATPLIDKAQYRYYLEFESESDSGSAARAGLVVHSVSVAFTVIAQDPGAG
jgi:hypothetical protein